MGTSGRPPMKIHNGSISDFIVSAIPWTPTDRRYGAHDNGRFIADHYIGRGYINISNMGCGQGGRYGHLGGGGSSNPHV